MCFLTNNYLFLIVFILIGFCADNVVENKDRLKQNEVMRVLLTLVVALFFSSPLAAYEDIPRCFQKLETEFFNERYVKEAMDIYNIYQSSWQPIYYDLERRAKEAPRRIKDIAKQDKKNPLEHPFNAKRAKEILLQVQRSIFVETLNYWRIWDERTIDGMFSSIQEKNKRILEECK